MWLFDVDGCLVDSMGATILRPHARELLQALHDRGVVVHVWSAGGDEYARRVAERVAVAELVSGFHTKVRDADGRWRLPAEVGGSGVVCVDDQPDGVPEGVATIAVFPFIGARPHDRTFARVLAELDGE